MALDPNTKPTDLGSNRTGVQAAPLRAGQMAENTGAVPADPDAGAMAVAVARTELSQDAPPLGTMPLPASVKGLAKAAVKALAGEKASVFLDKLGERLAFERSGVRLYEALLVKAAAARTSNGTLDVTQLREFREQELRHVHLVREALEHMGGDPTAVTPCADVIGTTALGLLQAISDPRTTLTQALDVILTAELADNDGWKLLVALAEALGQDELARRFAEALHEEDEHLVRVRRWVAERLELQLGAKLPAVEMGAPAGEA